MDDRSPNLSMWRVGASVANAFSAHSFFSILALMNSICSPSSSLSCLPSLHHNPTPLLQSQPNYKPLFPLPLFSSLSIKSTFTSPKSSIPAVTPTEGSIPVINFEDFVEKDWSFLDAEDITSNEVYKQNIDSIISSGKISEDSNILISTGSEGFIDRVIDTHSCKQLLVVHDSLFVLACIKEKYDKVKCWQGELIFVPEKWAPFDVVFLYFLPALPFELDQVFGTLSKICSPGARIVISHPKGREMVKQQKVEYPDIVVSDLPDKVTLESVAFDHSFTMLQFIDEPGFYLALLTHKT
ncbi:hypothetical protein L2E82_28584 [Cichorium intybus]|uniref:Uncharacterized protein n=1 Tax=Cichorium intybus TaxID=13427 RepID=A0ACB9CW55_CICIN|nr:hypothetical protein L2E82_28584 [Cichorium intybus]